MPKSADELFLEQALAAARAGIGLASPNPCVGAVIVDERGRIVGRGTHTYDGLKHAEVLAIEEAGNHARGNTLYLNLEPCSHTGRTGPCADAVIAAGIHRLVCSMQDPNPLVAGQGFQKLRDAGVDVEVGLLEAEARALNEAFAKFIRTRLPFVILKNSMSLDGRITSPEKQHGILSYISTEATLARVHELRHEADAILVGVGTVIADNPVLTDRSGKPRRRPLLRVVLDSKLRIPLGCKLVTTCNDDVLVFCAEDNPTKRAELEKAGVRVVVVPGNAERTDIAAVLRTLGELQILKLLVEGGSEVNAAFLEGGHADKLWVFMSPKIFGAGVPWIHNAHLGPGVPLIRIRTEQIGNEIAIEAYFRDVYA